MTEPAVEQPTLADILDAFHRMSEETQAFHKESKAERRGVEERTGRRLDDVLLRLGDFQKNVDARLDQVYAELDELRKETLMRLNDLTARVEDLEHGRVE